MVCKGMMSVLLVLIALMASVYPAYTAETPQAVLDRYVSELQKYPNDTVLREKIIRHALGMTPAPVVPEEAERYMARGVGAIETAKDQNGFKNAVMEFLKAALHAPWLPDAYYNLGIAQEKAGLYPEAIKSLKFYLLAAPDAGDVKAVKNLIYKIEYKQEAAVKDAQAAKESKKDLNGIWLHYFENGQLSDIGHYRVEMRGVDVQGFFVFDTNYGGQLKGSQRLDFRATLNDRNLRGKSAVWAAQPFNFECILTEDFREMNCKQSLSSSAYMFSLRRE